MVSPTTLRAHLTAGLAALSAEKRERVFKQPTLAGAVQFLIDETHGQPSMVAAPLDDAEAAPRTLVVYDVTKLTQHEWRTVSPTGWALSDPKSDERREDDVVVGAVILTAANCEEWHHASAGPNNPRERRYAIRTYDSVRKPRTEEVARRRKIILDDCINLSLVLGRSVRDILSDPDASGTHRQYAPPCAEFWLDARMREGHSRESAEFMLSLNASPAALTAIHDARDSARDGAGMAMA